MRSRGTCGCVRCCFRRVQSQAAGGQISCATLSHTHLFVFVLSRCTGHHRRNAEQAELDDLRLRQAVMAHHLEARRQQQQQYNNNDTMPLARKQELIHNFLLVDELTPALVRELLLVSSDDDSNNNNNNVVEDNSTTVGKLVLPACAVCLEPFQLGDAVGKAQNDACKHVYHKDCIAEWLLHNMDCPLCKRNFLSLANSEDGDADAEEETTSRTSVTSGDEESGRIVEQSV